MPGKKVKAFQKVKNGKKSEFWYYRFEIDGERYGPLCTYLTDQREADRMAQDAYDEAKGEAVKAKKEAVKRRNAPKDMTVDELCISYWERHVLANDLKDQAEIGRQLHVVRDLIGLDTMVSTIDDDVVETYVATLKGKVSEKTKRKLKPLTRNHQLQRLQAILNHARTVEKIATQVIEWKRFRVAKNKLQKRAKRFITAEESALIYAAMREDYLPIFAFDLATGLRRESLTDLTWDKVHEDLGLIITKQKGDRDLEIVITPDIAAILAAEKPHKTGRDSAVFTFVAQTDDTWTNPANGKSYVQGQRYPVTYWGLGNYWRYLIKRLDIPHVTLHDFRRTFATDFNKAAGRFHASIACGHSDERVTGEFYIAQTTADQIEAAHLAAELRARIGRTLTLQNQPQSQPQPDNG